MPEMTDPMDGLISLQAALYDGLVMSTCALHPQLRFLEDEPIPSEPRYTFAVMSAREVTCSVTFAQNGKYKGIPCYQVGYSVVAAARSKGLATRTVQSAIEELQSILSGGGIRRFYVEAVVASDNIPSNRLAARLLTANPDRGLDAQSGTATLTYLKLVGEA